MFGFGTTFNPDTDIPDLSGKVILVTGGTNGLGKEAITQLAKHNPSKIYMGARSEQKARDVIAEMAKIVPGNDAKIISLEMDLASFSSVKKAADAFLADNDRLDILMNNAGIMATPASVTKEGYEIQFGTNHVGHALLTKLLLPVLEKTAAQPGSDVRIINLSSLAHEWTPKGGIALDKVKSDMKETGTWERYGQSKLANVHFTTGLTKHYPKIKSVAIHPGSVNTGLKRGPMDSYPVVSKLINWAGGWVLSAVGTGTLNQLWAATARKEVVENGAFYYPVAKKHQGNAYVRDEKLTDKLWEWTEKELKEHGF
ncbi:retinol dehydrogenase [Pseudomassariella vexata]|uniref:Retinol dehydrogenase n=1 Tax=Pseudomassariella vexata TaxID=1141098 RepID=A0A1Y2DPA6_9PEZI|nr:retinol dehydrogenase [Pseudomassariella vexata]ORY60984.1 retinol dehydrogenase [Pseudomassariella vexata]